ncbi:MAG: hypothetical protein FWC89_13410 [Defluviitaleaceae bacterium]|nr:hypothetical protein [Defluviitaleaceae bacterium]
MREVFSRVDGGLEHLAEVARIGGGQVSTMQSAGTIVTQHSEAIRNQTMDIVREMMGREEDGSLRMNTLQQLLGRVATTQMARFLVNFPPLCVGISLASF